MLGKTPFLIEFGVTPETAVTTFQYPYGSAA
jgi:hypothetical protein